MSSDRVFLRHAAVFLLRAGSRRAALLLAVLCVMGPAVAADPAVVVTGAPTRQDAPSDYKVGPGDTLKITVLENPDLGGESRVRDTGDIRLPLIDQIHVVGLTVEQIEDLVHDRLRDGNFVKNARVLAAVTSFRSQRVSVLGEVARPGVYPLERPIRTSELMALAGGIQSQGSDQIRIRRGDDQHPVEVSVDLSAALASGRPDQDPYVQPGDIIYVPKAPIYFVKGEVARPGSFRLERNLSVQKAITNAGGLGVRGCESLISVKRELPDGRETELPVSLDDRLQPDDVVVVPVCQFYIYGEVQKPGPYRIDPGLTMQQALVLGGGATIRGNTRSVRVSRRDAQGRLSVLDDVKLDEEVRPNDVIYIKERLF